ncbi:FAD-dependent oxidoreductase [Pseudomonas sp. SWRI59]|uniref:FAD-dependent oxidoreductase n=1 Tax=unclassified Pseudomonas TaxID=196821 RepID=UPI001646F2C0|nr:MULTISPECIES: FAD-dependent oxidoreductase [unclassified Pseudomonas]MBC3503319.1 FAD-dependent oxidoreductase [Pseudomonas sp. SWRI59]MBC3508734.1 FAD-dependent oxidoreductase [Pseudomonas sp. SWRI68]
MPTLPTIAIVGAGPSGCFVAQFLEKKWPEAEISIFEALPVPYGLVRYGIAADHQGSKGVIQQFEKMFEKGNVKFFGNVSVGRDITFQKLAESFDVLVLATGLNHDAVLDVPTHPGAHVIGAGQILKALNGYPLHRLPKDVGGQIRSLGSDIAVIGSGNVAVDFVRMICKSSDEFLGSDVVDDVLAQLKSSGLKKIKLFSRSPASMVKCDGSMLEELLKLPGIRVSFEDAPEEQGRVPDILRMQKENMKAREGEKIEIELVFDVTINELDFVGGRTVISSLSKGAGALKVDGFDTVVTAIGFTNGVSENNLIPGNDCDGDAVYRVGWLRRGPKGTVAENRKDAKSVADKICQDFEDGLNRPGKVGRASVLHELSTNVVDYDGWRRIDRYEQSSAVKDRCRNKLRDLVAMIRVARGQDATTASADIV